MTPEQKRIRRLEQTVKTLAAWLVQAQTGFGIQDMRAIEDDIHRSREASPFPGEEGADTR